MGRWSIRLRSRIRPARSLFPGSWSTLYVIIFGIETSAPSPSRIRAADRCNNADWYQLLDLCAITDTLIADADGVYHSADFNDRLVLGLKGTKSEAELHLIKSRLTAGLKHKAAKGPTAARTSGRYGLRRGRPGDDHAG